MARIARIVVPQYPHHITQRGNRRQQTFFLEEDYQAKAKPRAGIEVWAYCLMPNHVHLVVVPHGEESLVKFFSDAHRRYTRRINFREGWRGHLWQERFYSSVMDEYHLFATVRYVELNPVRAGLCHLPADWAWSSVHAHLKGEDDSLVTVRPMLDRIKDWPVYLAMKEREQELSSIRKHAKTGRPIGDADFLDKLGRLTGRCLSRAKPGPKVDN